ADNMNGTEETVLIQHHSIGNKQNSRIPHKSALLIIDMQNDFIHGTLPVGGAESIIPIINKLSALSAWEFLALTTDYHPANHISFASNSPHNLEPFMSVDISYTDSRTVCGDEYKPIYHQSAAGNCTADDVHVHFSQELWPDHCIQGTWGQHIHKDVTVPKQAFLVRKGLTTVIDSYGAFTNNYGMYLTDRSPEALKLIEENSLTDSLNALGIQHVYVAGLALDYCVKYTALQALLRNFATYLILDATKPVMETTGQEAVHAVTAAGAMVVESCTILGTC
ncbi:PNC1, partial [Symbiodinium pilosum]